MLLTVSVNVTGTASLITFYCICLMGLIIFCDLCNICGIILIPNDHLRNVISSASYFVSNENFKSVLN